MYGDDVFTEVATPGDGRFHGDDVFTEAATPAKAGSGNPQMCWCNIKMKKGLKLFLIILFLTVFICFFYFRLYEYLQLSSLQLWQGYVKLFFSRFPVTSVCAYFVIYILVTGFSLPGAVVLTLAGGWFFGVLKGVVLVSLASSLGALMAFLCARFVLRDLLLKSRFKERMISISDNVKKEGVYYLLTLRLIPLFPFFLVNLAMGLSSMRPRTFFFVSQLGMLPATLLYVNAGTQLSKIEALKDVMSFPILISFSLLGVFPLVIRYFLKKKKM